jgi:hypothetical protein
MKHEWGHEFPHNFIAKLFVHELNNNHDVWCHKDFLILLS